MYPRNSKVSGVMMLIILPISSFNISCVHCTLNQQNIMYICNYSYIALFVEQSANNEDFKLYSLNISS